MTRCLLCAWMVWGTLAMGAAADVIDLTRNWRFAPDPNNDGVSRGLHTVDYNDGVWALLDAGARWEDQGYREVDGTAWYRRRVEVPADWAGKPAWLVLGGVNDACTIYANGQRIAAYGSEVEGGVSVNNVALVAALGPALQPGAVNTIAIRVVDWGGSGGLWRLPCLLTTDPRAVPDVPELRCTVDSEVGLLTAELDLAAFGDALTKGSMAVRVYPAGSDKPATGAHAPVEPQRRTATARVYLSEVTTGRTFRVEAALLDDRGLPLGNMTASAIVQWPVPPKWSGNYADLKVLNNFVTVLAEVSDPGASPETVVRTPRDGWVFVRHEAETPLRTPPTINVDGAWHLLEPRGYPDVAYEAMIAMDEGTHRVRIDGAGTGPLRITTVPELHYCYYPATPHIAPYGMYGEPFVRAEVLPHVNTIVTADASAGRPFSSVRWVFNAGLPGLNELNAPSADAVFDTWVQNPGVRDGAYQGLIVDEFLTAPAQHYAAWDTALRQLVASPGFDGKTFYAWCTDIYRDEPGLAFCRTVVETGQKFAWEKYLSEEPTEEEARQLIYRELVYEMSEWAKVVSGVQAHTVVTLGYLSAPPESLDVNPRVDYKVFLDKQMHALANDPAFWQLAGVMFYSSRYADEEYLRWAHRLFRHYAIEGHRTRFTDDPYVLPHLVNPDFADGLNGWTVEPANPGSVRVDSMAGYSWLQGRYPRTTTGDAFAVMEPSPKRPNVLRQTLQNLEPGRRYAVKLIASNLQHLEQPAPAHIAIEIVGAERVEPPSFAYVYPSSYAHAAAGFGADQPAHFTFKRVVFDATAPTAELLIRDRAAGELDTVPGEPQIAVNFIQVEPYFDRDN